MNRDIVERLQAAISKTGKSPRAISLEAGMSDGAVRGIVKNPHSSPTVETLANLARALDVTPEWLAYGVGQELPQSSTEIDSVLIRSDVAAGLWLSVDILPRTEDMDRAPIAYSPEWPRDAQYCLRVRGTSINNRASDGDLLRCIDIGMTGLEPQPGELVIVQQSRNDGAEIEVTAKILRRDGRKTILEPDSTDERHRPIVLDSSAPLDGVTARIIAVVDLVLKPMRRR